MKLLEKIKACREQGISLVEMMVVIGIISILTAIALPIYMTAQKDAARATINTDIINTATALNSYINNSVEGVTLDEPSQVITTTKFNSIKSQSPDNTIIFVSYTRNTPSNPRTNGKLEYCIQGVNTGMGVTVSYNLTEKVFENAACAASGK